MDGTALTALLQVSLLVFVVTSMLSMGLSLTIAQILEPLRNVKLVVVALAANFVVVPLLAWGIAELLSLDEALAIGLILMATAAGAPFLPKLAEVAKGNIAYSVGLMVVLMVVTVAYMPIVLPLMLNGVEINPWDIASSLIFLMLFPLAIGLVVKRRYDETANKLSPLMGQISSVALVFLAVGGIIVNFDGIIGIIGTGGLIAMVAFIGGAFLLGFVGGGSDTGVRSVLGLGTAQRNLAAALVVAGQNFSHDPNVLTFILVAAIVGIVLLFPIAGELAKRSATTT